MYVIKMDWSCLLYVLNYLKKEKKEKKDKKELQCLDIYELSIEKKYKCVEHVHFYTRYF